MVYEALKSADGALDAHKPIDVYWLDIDPEYQAAARKKGHKTDRVDVSSNTQYRQQGKTPEAQGQEEGG